MKLCRKSFWLRNQRRQWGVISWWLQSRVHPANLTFHRQQRVSEGKHRHCCECRHGLFSNTDSPGFPPKMLAEQPCCHGNSSGSTSKQTDWHAEFKSLFSGNLSSKFSYVIGGVFSRLLGQIYDPACRWGLKINVNGCLLGLWDRMLAGALWEQCQVHLSQQLRLFNLGPRLLWINSINSIWGGVESW